MNGLKIGQSKGAKNVTFWISEYYYFDLYSSVMLFQIISLTLCTLINRLNIRCSQASLCPARSNSMDPTGLLMF